MHKVIVERPRWTPGPDKYARRANLPDELLPKFEGIKRMRAQRKGQRDLLGPLCRWLQAQVGRPWNDVYSEACAVIHPDNYVRVHVKTHLLEFVERNTFMHDGKVCFLDAGRNRITPVAERQYGRIDFFVHPENGLLEAIPLISKRARQARQPQLPVTEHWISKNSSLRLIRGLWFECHFVRPDGVRVSVYDHALERWLRREELSRHHSRYLLCVRKRQLSRRELEHYGLRNAPVVRAQSSIECNRCRLTTALCISAARARQPQPPTVEVVWQIKYSIKTAHFFESTSKRRKGFPYETQVKRGFRVVHGNKELQEKLGRNDPCPCGSGRSFKNCCLRSGRYDGVRRNYYFRE